MQHNKEELRHYARVAAAWWRQIVKNVKESVAWRASVRNRSFSFGFISNQQPAVNHIWESITNMFVSYWIKEIFDHLPSELNVQVYVPTRDVLLIFRMLIVKYAC